MACEEKFMAFWASVKSVFRLISLILRLLWQEKSSLWNNMLKINIIRMRSFIGCLAALFVTLACCGQNDADSVSMSGFANVMIPEVPKNMTFAGESVPFEHFDVAESYQREMLVTLYMHSKTSLTLLKTKRYFSIIEPILERNGVPTDFKYLCCIESGLDEDAVSVAGAGGLWQFMPATGKSYGLLIDSGVDERFHIEKATEAACTMLKELYDKFGSWTLAAAAYNLGPNGVERRMGLQSGVDNYYDAYFPLETRRYMFRILSFKTLLEEGPEKYGYRIGKKDYYKPLTDFHEIEVSGANIDWPAVAEQNGTNYKMLRLLNNWIRDYDYKNTGGRTFKVRIPNNNFRSN